MGMPSSAIRTFTDPGMYFAGIRKLHIDGFITTRGDLRAESTRIDLHCLWMHRIDESLPRIMRITPSGKRSLILFATDPYQPEMQVSGIEISEAQIAMFGLDWPYYLRSSAACGWGTMSLIPEDLAAVSEAIIGRPFYATPICEPTQTECFAYDVWNKSCRGALSLADPCVGGGWCSHFAVGFGGLPQRRGGCVAIHPTGAYRDGRVAGRGGRTCR